MQQSDRTLVRDHGHHLQPGPTHLALNMFCQYIYLWMYVIPAADLYL